MIELPVNLTCTFQTLILLLAANGAPILASKLLGKNRALPIDLGHNLKDGKRLLGDSKTWRGLLAAILISSSMALLFGWNPITGAIFGLLAMLGDSLSSFIKRRLAFEPSSRARGLDTLPESLLPTLGLKQSLEINLPDILLIALIFFLLEEFVSPLLYQWHIRNRPY